MLQQPGEHDSIFPIPTPANALLPSSSGGLDLLPPSENAVTSFRAIDSRSVMTRWSVAWIAQDAVTLYVAPDEAAAVACVLDLDTPVLLVQWCPGWARVQLESGLAGFLKGNTQVVYSVSGFCEDDKVPLYSQPDANDTPRREIPRGERITIGRPLRTGAQEWRSVRLSSDEKGYVLGRVQLRDRKVETRDAAVWCCPECYTTNADSAARCKRCGASWLQSKGTLPMPQETKGADAVRDIINGVIGIIVGVVVATSWKTATDWPQVILLGTLAVGGYSIYKGMNALSK
jgi:ribosomal protein L40E